MQRSHQHYHWLIDCWCTKNNTWKWYENTGGGSGPQHMEPNHYHKTMHQQHWHWQNGWDLRSATLYFVAWPNATAANVATTSAMDTNVIDRIVIDWQCYHQLYQLSTQQRKPSQTQLFSQIISSYDIDATDYGVSYIVNGITINVRYALVAFCRFFFLSHPRNITEETYEIPTTRVFSGFVTHRWWIQYVVDQVPGSWHDSYIDSLCFTQLLTACFVFSHNHYNSNDTWHDSNTMNLWWMIIILYNTKWQQTVLFSDNRCHMSMPMHAHACYHITQPRWL